MDTILIFELFDTSYLNCYALMCKQKFNIENCHIDFSLKIFDFVNKKE